MIREGIDLSLAIRMDSREIYRGCSGSHGAAYLNTPPMTEAKKINAVAKSNPATILFLSAAPRRAAGLRGCRRGSDLNDRNFYYRA
jgi:hypothetical protein